MIGNLVRFSAAALLCGAMASTAVDAAWAQEQFNGGNTSNPTGTNGQIGNSACPQPDINGIKPLNWSCPTGPGSYALPTTTVTRPTGPPGSYLVPSVGPPGSYIQPEGGPGSYIVPPEGPPGSYLNSTAGGTQVRTGPGGAIILSPGSNQNANKEPGNAQSRQNQSRQTQSAQPQPRQDYGAMQGGVISNGSAAPYRQDYGAMQGGVVSNGIAAPYRQDTGAMQPTISGTNFTFGPQNASAQAVQGLVGLIGNSIANAAATKAAAAKRSSAANAAATNAQTAKVVNGFIKMLGTEP